nr:hypothetical protein [Tanacetum cinerariifolium]
MGLFSIAKVAMGGERLNFACCGGFVESGLQERYGLTETEEGVAGKGVQALGGKIGEQCIVHSGFKHGGDR